ncbi:hypothetical protein TELCIR_10999 [Teladorsagia circumcincta]|uniref:Uncharacterized protein n=1 Tax=Teladorsagia circumcincta TaxID=45464 RepID=A0A2G9UAP1_TELCI|nr:hypothetical protein TELCIR_10999 [Teladorsagia circumcincta]
MIDSEWCIDHALKGRVRDTKLWPFRSKMEVEEEKHKRNWEALNELRFSEEDQRQTIKSDFLPKMAGFMTAEYFRRESRRWRDPLEKALRPENILLKETNTSEAKTADLQD